MVSCSVNSHLVVQPITGKEDQKNNAYQMFQTFSNLDQGENAKKGIGIQLHQHLSEKHRRFPWKRAIGPLLWTTSFESQDSKAQGQLPKLGWSPRRRGNRAVTQPLVRMDPVFGGWLTDVKSRGRCGRIEYINICIYIYKGIYGRIFPLGWLLNVPSKKTQENISV